MGVAPHFRTSETLSTSTLGRIRWSADGRIAHACADFLGAATRGRCPNRSRGSAMRRGPGVRSRTPTASTRAGADFFVHCADAGPARPWTAMLYLNLARRRRRDALQGASARRSSSKPASSSRWNNFELARRRRHQPGATLSPGDEGPPWSPRRTKYGSHLHQIRSRCAAAYTARRVSVLEPAVRLGSRDH